MKVSRSSLVLTAAVTGLLGGTIARAAAPLQDTSKQDSTAKSKKSNTAKAATHSCAGKNSCKGQGFTEMDSKKDCAAAKAKAKADKSSS